MDKYEKELEVAKEIAKQAGKIMLDYSNGDQHIEIKEDKSMVTIADKKINHMVIEEISKQFNDIVIGEEESSGEFGTGRRWFCDPIDGTKSFVWGTHTAMFSLGLVIDGMPVVGVAYDPFSNSLYEAVLGHGSYCNGVKLSVSKKELNGGMVAATSSVLRIIDKPDNFIALSKKGVSFATFSGAVFKCCLIAKGRLVGFFSGQVSAHDMAAVQLIIEEAGGCVTGYDGKKLDYTKRFKGAVASNGVVHQELISSLTLN